MIALPVLVGQFYWGAKTFRRLPFLPFLGLFFLTACIGAWVGYDPSASLAKLWLIVGGLIIYFAIAAQPGENLLALTGGLSVLGALISIYFLLSADWRSQPADIGLINRLGIGWMTLRPGLHLPGLHPNRAGGLIAMLFPFSLAWVAITWGKRPIRARLEEKVCSLAAMSISVLGLLFSSSRAAWLALTFALGVWGLWRWRFSLRTRLPRWGLPTIDLVAYLSALFLAGWVITHPGLVEKLVNRLPGPNSAVTRMEIYVNTLGLIRDYPFTGGGLAAFPGLYSRYIMNVPVFLFNYSHNLFLDVALEQGLLGFLSLFGVLAGGLTLLLRKSSDLTIRGATLAGLLILILHGLVDDPLYGGRGTPLLFVLIGLASTIDQNGPIGKPMISKSGNARQIWQRLGSLAGFLLIGLLAFLYIIPGSWKAAWFANLGAVEMARLELEDFPSGKWEEAAILVRLSHAQALFERALGYEATNFTANYRLGLMDLLRQDFPVAQTHLENAYTSNPRHRGVQKALGYCSAWEEEYPRAIALLRDLPEARNELSAYVWWWDQHDRQDLSQRAGVLLSLLP